MSLPWPDLTTEEWEVLLAEQQAKRHDLYSVDQPRDELGRFATTDSAPFKQWFQDSAVVDEDGQPLRVYHGTTHDIEAFKPAGAEGLNPESDWGAGTYFTSHPHDASVNYAGEGPDLTSRIETRAEQIQSQTNFEDRASGSRAEISREAALAQARSELAGKSASVIPAYLSMQKPLVVGKPNGTSPTRETHFHSEYIYDDPHNPDSDIVGEKGTLPDLLGALHHEAAKYDDNFRGAAKAVDRFTDRVSGEDSVSASRVVKLWKESSEHLIEHPLTGQIMNSEVLRAALQHIGFDGVIDRTVDEKFGSSRKHGKKMEGIDPDTTHFITFAPTQAKSAIGNTTFDPTNPKLVLTYREKLQLLLGGKGSGNFGHRGRKGEVGGSAPDDTAIGLIRNGSVSVRDLKGRDPYDVGHEELWQKLVPASSRFRYNKGKIEWLDQPNSDDYFAVDDHFANKGWPIIGHYGQTFGNKIPPPPPISYRAKLQSLLLGNERSGNYGHAGRPGEVGGSAKGDASTRKSSRDPVEQKFRDFQALLKRSTLEEHHIDRLRTEMNDAWKAWSADTQNRKRPLKPDGAAAKKLPSYAAAKALEADFHAKYEGVMARERALVAKATEMLKVPRDQRSTLSFTEDAGGSLHPAVVASANRALANFRQFDGSGAFVPMKIPAEMVSKFSEVFGDTTKLAQNADGSYSFPPALRLAKATGARANATLGAIHVTGGQDLDKQVYHEVAHHIEFNKDKVLSAAVALREKLADQPRVEYSLREHKPSLDADERALKGKFPDPYSAKLYPKDVATEMTSTGVESYMANPVAFARTREEHFKFIFDVLHGKYRS